MGRRRNQEPEKHANHERWLITYSDLITLLMVFFIIMYTMSNVNAKKFAAVANSLKDNLAGTSSTPYMVGEAPGPSAIKDMSAASQTPEALEQQNLNKAQKKLEEYIQSQGLAAKVEVGQEERGLVISLKETLLFSIGSADLNPRAKEVIQKIGSVLLSLDNNLRIEGHTCNLPIKTNRFQSNWELSTTRATNVVQYLINNVKYPAERLSATGYGEFRPLAPNTSEINRARNRRVDIVVIRDIYSATEPNK